MNRASVAVLNRNWGPLQFKAGDSKGWLELSTAKMRIRYRLRSGRFDAANLLISWSDAQGDHLWKPGDKDDKNLGGVPGDIALRTVPGTEPGALSRNGYFVLDDSRTAVWNNAGDWVEPRADQDEQDWYFFVYGLDFQGLVAGVGTVAWAHSHGAALCIRQLVWLARGIFRRRMEKDYSSLSRRAGSAGYCDAGFRFTAKIIWAGRDWDVEQMPDPAGFIKFANSQGVKVVVNEHYGALTPQNCSNFERIRTAMGLLPGTKLISHDLASKKYAEIYMDILNKPALQAGLAFWWQDGNAHANMPGLDATLWTRHVEYTGAERITGRRAFDFERLDVPYQKTNTTPAWGGHRYGGFFTGALAHAESAGSFQCPGRQYAASLCDQ